MKHLTTAEIAVIKARILRGDRYHEIASDYRINQGRLSDLKFGRIFPDVLPAELTAPPSASRDTSKAAKLGRRKKHAQGFFGQNQ